MTYQDDWSRQKDHRQNGEGGDPESLEKVTVTSCYSILHTAPHAACLLRVNAGAAAAASLEQEE